MNTLDVWKNINDQLSNFVFAKIKDQDITKDIVQDVFVKVFTKKNTLQNPNKTVAWIYQIARNEIINHFRKAKITTSTDDFEIEDTPTETLTSNLSQCLRPLIDSLPPKYKEALILADIKQMPQKDIAKELNISYSGAKSRVQRGRELLKSTYQKCCTITTDVYGDVLDYEQNDCITHPPKECSSNCD